MEKITVAFKRTVDSSYPIIIGCGILEQLPAMLEREPLGARYAVITDQFVEKLFGSNLIEELQKLNILADMISLKPGEHNKRLTTYGEVAEKLFALGHDRKSCILSLGGGVIGDLAGFLAATYMRGINYAHIPTTLLAMADSSIGGKVGIDLRQGKNILGAFHHPKKVFIDPLLLADLPKTEMQNGLAECAKHGLVADKGIFDFIKKNLSGIFGKGPAVLTELVARNCALKASIIQEDEKEHGKRALVNYGHTVGHALEAITHYKKYSHGQAVSIGMHAAAIISHRMGCLEKKDLDAQQELLEKIGLPSILPDVPLEKLLAIMRKDKKSANGKINFVILEGIGRGNYGVNVPEQLILACLAEAQHGD